MKRFTETGKWSKSWFRQLPVKYKCLWNYLCENCDAAGVWEPDPELADFQIGESIEWNKVGEIFGDRVKVLRNGKWWIAGFIEFQYGDLSIHCKPHQAIIRLVKKHELPVSIENDPNPIDTLSERVPDTLEEPEQEKEKEKEKGGVGGSRKQLTDEEFIQTLKVNPAYAGIDIDAQLGRMDSWLLVNRGRQKTRKFIVNWLNRCEKPVSVSAETDPKKKYSFEFLEKKAS